MTDEWTIVELEGANRDGEPRRYAIADGASVSVGQPLQLLDDRTVQLPTGVPVATQVPCAGVAAEEHVAGQGVKVISVNTQGLFRAVASAAILIGDYLAIDSENRVIASSATLTAPRSFLRTHGNIRALDAVTDGQTLTVRLDA